MQTTLIHSDPPRQNRRRTGGSLSAQIQGNDLKDTVLLATFLDMLRDLFDVVIAELSEEGLEEIFQPVTESESKASLHFMLHPNHKDIILEIEVTSWVYELPERDFHDFLFEKMKPAFLEIFKEFTFEMPSSDDPEGWFRMMKMGAILLHRNRS